MYEHTHMLSYSYTLPVYARKYSNIVYVCSVHIYFDLYTKNRIVSPPRCCARTYTNRSKHLWTTTTYDDGDKSSVETAAALLYVQCEGRTSGRRPRPRRDATFAPHQWRWSMMRRNVLVVVVVVGRVCSPSLWWHRRLHVRSQ